MVKANCQIHEPAYIFNYPELDKLTKKQRDILWPPDEVDVEKDKQSFLVDMTESEQHGVIEALKLFTHYEVKAGLDYWGHSFLKRFPNTSFQTMGNCFSFVEINIHAIFYNKLNEVLHKNTKDFYMSYKQSKELSDRMDFVSKMIKDDDDLMSLAAFSLIEGAVLYSSFAFLKHFQSNGKNKIPNTVRGIDFSVRDENIHSVGGAMAFNILKRELMALNTPESYFKDIEEKIIKCARQVYDHECYIIKRLFQKGPIEGFTEVQMKHFMESRVNMCLNNLGIKSIFKVTYNPIADWFYTGINAYQMNDFFAGTGNEYNRSWDMTKFKW